MSDGSSRRSNLFDAPRSGTDVFAAARAGDETVGAALARIREANGLQVSDIAQHLRIRETFLVALEEGDLGKLPGNTYAIGFVRSYASLLGVDSEEAVALFKEQRAGEANPAALVFPEPVAESRIPKGAILFISVLLAATAYGGWYYMSSRDMELADLVPEVPAALRDEAPDGQRADAAPERTVPPPETVPPPDGEAVPQRAAPPADRMAAPAPDTGAVTAPEESPASSPESSGPAEEQASTEPSRAETASSQPAAPDPEVPAPGTSTAEAPAPETSIGDGEPAPAAEPEAAPVPESEAAREEAPAAAAESGSPAGPTMSNPRIVETVPQPPPVESGPAPDGAASSAAETSAAPEGSGTGETRVARSDATIELHARSDSWVQIRGRDGRVVLMRILRTGDSYTVPNEAGLSLMTGNAGAIEITVDGETVPSIGPVGAVRRDVALDAARLRAGTAVDR